VAGGARIVDRGYQHYDGERHGAGRSVLAITTGTMRRALGFKRPTSAKVLPVLLVIGAFLPAIAVIIFRVLFPTRVLRRLTSPDQLWPYPRYFGWLELIVVVLAALAASEALCPDRRQRVLSLYYASPISPMLYLLGQMLAVTTVLLLVALAPVFLLWAANVGLADDSITYFRDHADQALRILAAGGIVAIVNAALALAVSAYTERKAYAAAALIGGVLAISGVAAIIRGAVHADWAKFSILFDPLTTPPHVAQWLFNQRLEPDVSGWLYLIAALIVAAGGLLITVRAYRSVSF
jgi:ABC-2 type transport system permease protein